VQVRYDEGVATHIGPEPCGVIREDGGEASAGERTGQPLSPENHDIPDADAVNYVEGKTSGASSRALRGSGVVEDPGMCRSSLRGNREVSLSTCGRTPQVRIGKVRSRSR
jgi:hypothetical protein